jgi:isopenicillin-N epimerase
VSWGWHHDRSRPDEPDEFGSTPRLRAFEFEGFRDPCPWLTVPTAIDFQGGIGWERLRGRIAELAQHVRRRLDGLRDLRLVTPPHPGLHGALTAFRLPRAAISKPLQRLLWERYRIEVPVFPQADGSLLRVSTHFYNTEKEVDLLAQALDEEMK